MCNLKSTYLCLLIILCCLHGKSQSVEVALPKDSSLNATLQLASNRLLVRAIHVSGNKHTKAYIILREIQFKPGDSINPNQVYESLQLARQQIYNTTLFNEVKIDLAMISAFEIDVNVSVKERWYLYPAPQFQPVDRNLNEWLVKYKGDLSRVNYGVKFVHYNFSGRRDALRIFLINGYSRNIAFSYSQPYSNRKLTQGFGVGGGFTQGREMAYKTSYNNEILFYKKEGFVRKNWYVNLSYRLQKGILSRQVLNLSYSALTIDDSVITTRYNPAYFNSNTTKKGLLDLSYNWLYANVNNVSYPLKGTAASVLVTKRGLGITGGVNLLNTELSYNKYWAHQRNWYTSLQLSGNIKLPFDQPYINQRALGYGENNLRGLEYYVVDGVAYALVRSTLKKKILSFSIPFPFKSKTHTSIPFTFFAKTFVDAGLSYSKREYITNLNNRLLYSGGFGLDILSFYDISLRLEYSFNQLGESGLFVKSKGGL